ncbi:MAG: hypothetical protein ACPIOQ_26345 [Promethearchaeia archaeon]
MIALQGLQRRLLLEDVERCEFLHVPAVPPSTPPAGRPPQAPRRSSRLQAMGNEDGAASALVERLRQSVV